MCASFDAALDQAGILVIDGSMSTALEQMGCDLNDSLWTAKVLAEQPDLVRQVHENYFRAGADCGITCSYQATIPGLMAHGYTQGEAEDLIRRSVELFRQARENWWQAEGKAAGRVFPLCLAGIGPYGAYLADGSEYRGRYGVSADTLRDFHRRRMELLWQTGADVLLIETDPSLEEALIEADIAEELGADYWISFSCKDGQHINEGTPIRDCVAALAQGHPHLKMVGVNCTPPQYIEELIGECRKGGDLPVGVYPNSGETYDPATKTWHGSRMSITFGDYARRWMRAGAKAVGGCCRTVDIHVKQVVQARAAVLGK